MTGCKLLVCFCFITYTSLSSGRSGCSSPKMRLAEWWSNSSLGSSGSCSGCTSRSVCGSPSADGSCRP
eukprot:3658745-Heterocapsa_arctica.AAC.1